MKGYSHGGILGEKLEEKISTCINPGKILVGKDRFDRLGSTLIRDIYGDKNAEIIVVPDESLAKMSALERMKLLSCSGF